ncbi:A/G-specific adenine glycosylase [Candidatus Thorarchaeota archaeon]|jgi:A/G-specific adenine glycosylase|nr:MAG: A/G-specific adenine glycosylase [Candidatus Thorarchaeota archaeon]
MTEERRYTPSVHHRVSQAITLWQREHGRDYAWRHDSSPYEVLVAEMMLRRTTAKAVSRVYPVFIREYRRPKDLASASVRSISRIVAPLGLQRIRSKHLKETARIITQDYGGEVPSDSSSLLALPGVGRYVAAAVRNFAFGKPEPLVDGNTLHLLSRVFGTSFSGPDDEDAWEFMKQFGRPNHEPPLYWGVIDLVSSTCRRRKPLCSSCPLADYCLWKADHFYENEA